MPHIISFNQKQAQKWTCFFVYSTFQSMDNWLLKVKHWQIFLFLATVCYLNQHYLRIDSLASCCITTTLIVLYLGWYILLGNTLYQYLPRKISYSLIWFLTSALSVIATFAAATMLFDGQIIFTGLAAIPGLYVFFAVIHLLWFPAALLVAIETKEKPGFSQYAGTLLQLLFWPIRIWFVQPRLNRVYNAIQSDTLDYPRS